MVVCPQFPLGTVLFPSMVLPLHIFEPRYRVMVEHVLDGDGTFGVVLIERGSEVGGEDQRTNHGTLARVVDAQRLDDGRWHLITLGTERFRVDEWLPDDPYPVADVRMWPDEAVPANGSLEPAYSALLPKVRRYLALASEAGYNVGALLEQLTTDRPSCMQLAAMTPLTVLDKQALLGAPGPAERVPMLLHMVDDALGLLQCRLGLTDDDVDDGWHDWS
ncbi:MAG: LON peptidase substrate-binding domain-containing protein [Acidimicrobiales bacterium]